MPAGMVPEVTMADFMRYLRVIGDKHNRFSQLRQESMNDQRRKISVTDITPGMWRMILERQITWDGHMQLQAWVIGMDAEAQECIPKCRIHKV